jgi:hypothetical protein
LFLFWRSKKENTTDRVQLKQANFLLHAQAVFTLLFFLIKKEAKKSRTKDVHPLRPAAMTIGCATVASAFIVCCGLYFTNLFYNRKRKFA